MELNSIIFPAPNSERITDLNKYKEELLYIPKFDKSGKKKHIPVMLHNCRKNQNSNKYLIYFHGNAEDIFNSNYTVDLTRSVLPFNTLSVEYPGYSVYNDEKSSETIQEDALIVYDFLTNTVGIKESDIIICGRSIGSGPSIYLCSKRKPGGLILISPFTSIGEVVKSIVGFWNFIIKDRFSNIDIISKVQSPILFIHGQKDDIVPFEHSLLLSKKCQCPYEIILPDDMDHNEIHIYDDFLEPVTTFLQRNNLMTNGYKDNKDNKDFKEEKKIVIDEKYFEIPEELGGTSGSNNNSSNKDFVTKFVRKFFNIN